MTRPTWTHPDHPLGDADPRFTFGLMIEVARVLEKHGYPTLLRDSNGFVELELGLFAVISKLAAKERAEGRTEGQDRP